MQPTALVLKEISGLVSQDVAEVALRIANLGNELKTDLLRRMEAHELHDHPAYSRIQRINFWPWSGTLQGVISDLGKDHIMSYWKECIGRAKQEAVLLGEMLGNRHILHEAKKSKTKRVKEYIGKKLKGARQ